MFTVPGSRLGTTRYPEQPERIHTGSPLDDVVMEDNFSGTGVSPVAFAGQEGQAGRLGEFSLAG